jgi:U4/U6 small nuclear ribonucleoprotein PRP31
MIRTLPIPEDKPRRKRGGKRMKKANKRFEMTEMRKASNIIKFGPEA